MVDLSSSFSVCLPGRVTSSWVFGFSHPSLIRAGISGPDCGDHQLGDLWNPRQTGHDLVVDEWGNPALNGAIKMETPSINWVGFQPAPRLISWEYHGDFM